MKMPEDNQISLRKAQKQDLMFYFQLRNEPSVRVLSFSAEPVDIATHTTWFSQKLQDPNTYLFVIEVGNELIGQIRVDVEDNQGEVSIAIVPEHRGKGYAALAIQEASERVFEEAAYVDAMVAHMKIENIASQKSFKRAGFLDNGAVSYKGYECKEMMVRKNQ